MKPSAFLVVVLALLLSTPSANAQTTLVIDQSFTSPTNLGANINDCCKFVAQTFTAGRSGVLAGVNIDVLSNKSSRLHVAIRTVEDGAPGTTILGETVLASSSAALSQLITFPGQIIVASGHQYAIVVNYDGAPPPGPFGEGLWLGATGDVYPRGALIFSVTGATWFAIGFGYDVHFRTYVAGPRELLVAIAEAVEQVGPGTSLADKLNDALVALDSDDGAGACSILRAFVHEVSAQDGKSIPSDTATSLISSATQIEALLNC